MSKKAIKKSERNTPVRKSIRIRKHAASEATRREQIAESRRFTDEGGTAVR